MRRRWQGGLLTGLGRQGVDAARKQITPTPELSSTAAGAVRRMAAAQRLATGLAAVMERMMTLLPRRLRQR